MGDFNHPDNCFKSSTRITEIKQSRLLQSCNENFLIKMPKEFRKEDTLINFTFQRPSHNYEGLGCSKHKMVEFRIFRGERETVGSQT